MSDLTTLATIRRCGQRARERYVRGVELHDVPPVNPSALILFDYLMQELAREMQPRDPISLGDNRG